MVEKEEDWLEETEVASLHVRYVSTVSVTQLETLFLTVSVGSHSPAQAIRRSS